MTVVSGLSRAIAQEDAVLFIGSGISCWSGLPTWTGLIKELADFLEAEGISPGLVRAELARGDLLQAASYGFDKLTQSQASDFVRKASRQGRAQPHDIHRLIVTLGPRCFITTNYDNLIEESLRQWVPDRFFPPPITNLQLTEMAGLVQARAVDFVFKPHGDIFQAQSIVLTREHYRSLLPSGERRATLDSLKTLLATRPVIYLGFGLRDPDFLLLRDTLANTFNGGIRDHYAVMADVHEQEVDYWRRNYGIHLIGYATRTLASGAQDHSELLQLLQGLHSKPVADAAESKESSPREPTAEFLLSVARHAARLSRVNRVDNELPLRVARTVGDRRREHDLFARYSVEEFLDAGARRAVLIGLPGAGKSYALRRSAARLSQTLHEFCMGERDLVEPTVPVVIDLRLYQGDLWSLVESVLPTSIQLSTLPGRFRLRLYLDSFNEMPKEYRENNHYESDFSEFVKRMPTADIVIGSRDDDGLKRLEFPTFRLEEVERSFVESELKRLDLSPTGMFERELVHLLQKPFFFQLVSSGRITIPANAQPKDLYESYFGSLARDFEARFNAPASPLRCLDLAAFESMDNGAEAQPSSLIMGLLDEHLSGLGIEGVSSVDVVNWLISRSVLVPLTSTRLALFHQSVTEFLAARELSVRYSEDPSILARKLKLTRWDQSLFLTLSLLPAARATSFLNSVAKADVQLAFRAVKYAEVDREGIISRLLTFVCKAEVEASGVAHFFLPSDLPVALAHEPLLRELMARRGSIGGEAAVLLVGLRGAAVKSEFLNLLVEARDDYNFCCNGVGPSLMDLVEGEDLQSLAEAAAKLEADGHVDPEEVRGFVGGAAAALGNIDIEKVIDAFLPSWELPLPPLRTEIVLDLLRDHKSPRAFKVAAQLLELGVAGAAFTVFLIGRYSDAEVQWACLGPTHVERLLSLIESDKEAGGWALELLLLVGAKRPELLEGSAKGQRPSSTASCTVDGLVKYARSSNVDFVFEALRSLGSMAKEQRAKEPVQLIQHVSLDWEGRERLLVELLHLREVDIALALLEKLTMSVNKDEQRKGKVVEVGPIQWWLDWLGDDSPAAGERHFWLCERLPRFLAMYTTKDAVVDEFNKDGSRHRQVLSSMVLVARSDVTTDDLSEEAISYLLAGLNKPIANDFSWRGHLLGQAATEKFVADRLLPLWERARGKFKRRLTGILRAAGSRHGRRYVGAYTGDHLK
ncbi:MAG TPA: SIR2 family protein [Polyangiaceae bacterium]|nr:SIR2 family protein [Polyangiaceae bacterium]